MSVLRHMEAVGNRDVGLNFNFGLYGKPVSETLSTPLKKNKTSKEVLSSPAGLASTYVDIKRYTHTAIL